MVDLSFEHDTAVSEQPVAETLIVDVDGFEGPLDLLLAMSRRQQIDLMKISILALAQQYLQFVERAKALRIELAADYLVMAAWLAFLKSRLLLPPEADEDGPTGEELVHHLAFQLERLQAMRDSAAQLMARDHLGRDFFVRGMPETIRQSRRIQYTATLLDLTQGYARIRTREEFRPLSFDQLKVLSIERALDRLKAVVGKVVDWADLMTYLPEEAQLDTGLKRSATASTLAAALELVKMGQIEIRQTEEFAPIKIKVKDSFS